MTERYSTQVVSYMEGTKIPLMVDTKKTKVWL